MEKAQTWLDRNYPNSRKKHTEVLDISNKNLEGFLNLEEFIKLKKLYCSNNQLSELDIRNCPKLDRLYCSNNSKLKKLYISGVDDTDWEKVREVLKNYLKEKKDGQYYDLKAWKKVKNSPVITRPLLSRISSSSSHSSSAFNTTNRSSFSPTSSPSSIMENNEMNELRKEIKKLNNKNEELRKESQQLSQQLMEYKYKELLQIEEIEKRIENDEEVEMKPREIRELTKKGESLRQSLKELKKNNIKTLLIIGEINKGKSTLANVLSMSEQFHENHSGSRNQEVRDKEFDEDWLRYRVVDTGGIGEEEINSLKDNNLSKKLSLEKMTEFINLTGKGLNQILLVVDAGSVMNEKWINFYKLLNSIIFDDNIGKYITIVRTKFPDFDNEKECQKEQRVIHSNITKYLDISSDKIIFVDNDPNNEERRINSHKVLLNHLKENCQDIYRPKNLEKLSEILKKENIDFDEEKVKEEIEIYYQQEDKKGKINNQLVKTTELTGVGIGMVSSVITFITTIAGIASCRIM